MKIKINDKVQVMVGKDKGKTGKVIQVLSAMDKVVVEGANTMYKHIKSRKKGEKGQRVEFSGPIRLNNVMLICPKCGQPTKVGFKIVDSGESAGKLKSRICRKCQENID